MKILLILAKTLEKPKLNFPRTELFHMKTRLSLKRFVNDCSPRNKKRTPKKFFYFSEINVSYILGRMLTKQIKTFSHARKNADQVQNKKMSYTSGSLLIIIRDDC